MEIGITTGDITNVDVGAIVVNVFEGVRDPSGATKSVDCTLGGAITKLISDGEITGKKGEITLIHTLGKMMADRVIVAGLGNQETLSAESIRYMMGEVSRFVRKLGVRRSATVAHGVSEGGIDPLISGQAITEGALLGLYRFQVYKSRRDDEAQIEEIQIVEQDVNKIDLLQQGVSRGKVLAKATIFARDMNNEPANVMNPSEMVERARRVSEETGLDLKILDKPEMIELGMGALLAVAAGSNQPPKLIVLTYDGDPDNEGNNIALCGKGITFDSGGISIKPAAGMGEMKGDMSGGGAVIGAMGAIAQLKLKINVMGLVPATENMSGGSASRPGDVVRAMTGKSIEIENTDAEGRLVLADAIGYARKHGRRRLVDIATLTGAAVVALGKTTSAVIGNDQSLIDRMLEAGEATGEKVWQLPLFEEYKELNKSKIADVKNTGGRDAGAITAAQFISEFAEDVPWVHMDIAGTARTSTNSGYLVAGSTGVGVRTLIRLIEALAENPG